MHADELLVIFGFLPKETWLVYGVHFCGSLGWSISPEAHGRSSASSRDAILHMRSEFELEAAYMSAYCGDLPLLRWARVVLTVFMMGGTGG